MRGVSVLGGVEDVVCGPESLDAIDDETDPEFACCFYECKRAYVVDSNVFKNFG